MMPCDKGLSIEGIAKTFFEIVWVPFGLLKTIILDKGKILHIHFSL